MLDKTGCGLYISSMLEEPSIQVRAVGASNVTFDATIDMESDTPVETGFPISLHS